MQRAVVGEGKGHSCYDLEVVKDLNVKYKRKSRRERESVIFTSLERGGTGVVCVGEVRKEGSQYYLRR